MLLVNCGSDIAAPASAIGWTNTYSGARTAADAWLKKIREQGIADVDLYRCDPTERDGRWDFVFRHTVTGIQVTLTTHGINDLDAYRRQNLFEPRVYWNGSSSSDPQLSDFTAAGYAMTFRPVTG